MARYGTINQKTLDNTPGTDGQFLRRLSGVWVPYTLQPSDIPSSVRSQLQVTASRNLATTDAGRHLYSNSASNFDLTIPNNVFAANDEIEIAADGTGLINILAGSGFTINGSTAAVCYPETAGFLKFRSPSDARWYGGTSLDQPSALNRAYGLWHWQTIPAISSTTGLSAGNGALCLYTFYTGTGATASVDGSLDPTKLGILNHTTGTTTTGRTGLVLASGSSLTGAQFHQRLQSGVTLIADVLIRVPTLSVAASEAFRLFCGWANSLTPSSGNMACIYVDENSNVVGITANSGVASTVPIGVLTANQWFRLRITATNSVVRFQFNNNAIESLTTNIPTGGMTFHTTQLKTLGTTARTMQVDYHFLDITYPSQF
jgi:hypothetical protein